MKYKFLILPLAVSLIASCYADVKVPLRKSPTAEAIVEDGSPLIGYDGRFKPVIAKNGMVSSSDVIASQVGADILAAGGNAVDAAVAVGFALAVTYPQAGNIGGGGFMMVYMKDANKTVAIDYREMAPALAHRDMFLGKDGSVDRLMVRRSRRAAGVPGTVAGLLHALNKYGTMTAAQVIAPAYKLAYGGFEMSYSLAKSMKAKKTKLSKSLETRKVFLHDDLSPYKFGEILKQPDLAWTLKQIMQRGVKGFYEGAVAQKIHDDMAKNGGIMTKSDLKAYKTIEREPIIGTYKNYKVATMPPPSSGGIHLVQMMNMLENDSLKSHGHNSARNMHLYIEAMRQAYADRSEYLGDPDFSSVPIKALIDKKYAAKIRAVIPKHRARRSGEVKPALGAKYESPDTTHYSVMDKFGNVVSNTYTINFSYGSGIMVAGTGMLLNNEMDDFSAKPGVPNGFGLLGGEANSVQPRKRPLSSMTPVIVFKNNEPLFATGSPGGSTIITVVLQTVLNVVEFDMDISAATGAPRLHHQWYPDVTSIETGFSVDTLNILRSMGHKISRQKRTFGSTQSVLRKDGFFYGSADARRTGAAAIGVK